MLIRHLAPATSPNSTHQPCLLHQKTCSQLWNILPRNRLKNIWTISLTTLVHTIWPQPPWAMLLTQLSLLMMYQLHTTCSSKTINSQINMATITTMSKRKSTPHLHRIRSPIRTDNKPHNKPWLLVHLQTQFLLVTLYHPSTSWLTQTGWSLNTLRAVSPRPNFKQSQLPCKHTPRSIALTFTKHLQNPTL